MAVYLEAAAGKIGIYRVFEKSLTLTHWLKDTGSEAESFNLSL